MKLWIYGAIIVALFTAGWLAGNKHGKAEVQAVLDRQRDTWQAEFTRQSVKTAAKEAVWAAKNKELDDAWKSKLDAAESAVGGLSARLRRAANRAGSCTLSADPAAAGTPADSTVPDSAAELERLSDGAWRACSADSAALIEVVTRYNNLRIAP